MDYQRELLGGSSFLDRYEEQLSSLCRNQRFINMISLASKEAAEKTGSDTGKAGKNIISDTLFRERAYLLLPEYAHIVDDVARSGYSKKSAVLSIYYAAKILNASSSCGSYSASQANESAACQQDYHAQNSSNANARRIWEEIAFIIDKYRKDGAPEREFQIEMENAFEKLGWSGRLGEVIAQYTIPVGSAHSVRPDLIIAKEGTPIFVVELKKPSSGATPRNADQLFSYMRLLKLNVGLLISDVVQLYYDDPSNADNPRLVESIPARSDCEEGPILFDLLMKDGFAKSSLNAYIAETLSQQTTLTQVQYLRSAGFFQEQRGYAGRTKRLLIFPILRPPKTSFTTPSEFTSKRSIPPGGCLSSTRWSRYQMGKSTSVEQFPARPNIGSRGAHQQRVILLPHKRTLPLSRQKGRPNCERPPEGHARERKRIS